MQQHLPSWLLGQLNTKLQGAWHKGAQPTLLRGNVRIFFLTCNLDLFLCNFSPLCLVLPSGITESESTFPSMWHPSSYFKALIVSHLQALLRFAHRIWFPHPFQLVLPKMTFLNYNAQYWTQFSKCLIERNCYFSWSVLFDSVNEAQHCISFSLQLQDTTLLVHVQLVVSQGIYSKSFLHVLLLSQICFTLCSH